MQQRHNQKKGFSLIEAAIVLAVVGGVIGAIWVAASAVSFHFQEQKFLQGFLTQKGNVEKYLSQSLACNATMLAGASGTFFKYVSPYTYSRVRPKEWDEIDISQFCHTTGCITTSIACDANETRYYAVWVRVPESDQCYRYYDYLQKRGLLLGSNSCNLPAGSRSFNVFYEIPRRS